MRQLRIRKLEMKIIIIENGVIEWDKLRMRWDNEAIENKTIENEVIETRLLREMMRQMSMSWEKWGNWE